MNRLAAGAIAGMVLEAGMWAQGAAKCSAYNDAVFGFSMSAPRFNGEAAARQSLRVTFLGPRPTASPAT